MSNEQPSHAPLKTLALDALHRELGAKMGGFAGFDMPIQYALGLKAEHLHTRAQAGLFDVSHMGQLYITAKDGTMGSLKRGLEAALPIDFDGWPIDLQKYSYLLNDQGGIEDDLMLTLRSDHVRMVVNAGNRDADLLLLQRLAPDLHFNWVDAALLALQGPAAQSALAALDTEGNAANLSFMQATDVHLFGKPCYTTRSGYTGEDGYEISIPTAVALQVARQLLADPRVQCIGLGARDSLRLEAGLPLHGNDISPLTTPLEAGLAFAIPKSRRPGGAKQGGYPGAAQLQAQWQGSRPIKRKLMGLISNEAIPIRAHALLETSLGKSAGEVTSGTVSPTLGQPIMLAYVDVDCVAELSANNGLVALVRDKRPAVAHQPLPFVAKRYKRAPPSG